MRPSNNPLLPIPREKAKLPTKLAEPDLFPASSWKAIRILVK